MKLELKWALLAFIMHQTWHLGEKLLGFYGSSNSYNVISGLVFAALYSFFIFIMLGQLKKKNGGFLHRRQALLSGIFVSLFLLASAPITIFMLNFVIEPGYFNKMILLALDTGEYSSYGEAKLEYGFWNYVILYMALYMLVGVGSAALYGFILHKLPEPIAE